MDMPNVVYVFADQLRADCCGFNGSDKGATPNLDRLAGECINLTNAVSGHPVCAPYRASLFTGKYSSSTGMAINELRLSPDHRCLGHVLTDFGFETAYIGKWHLWANQLGHHDDPNNSHIPRGPYRLGFDDYWAAYNFHHVYHDAYYHTESQERVIIPGYEPDAQTDLVIERLERLKSGDKPFALFLSYGTPHDPWDKSNVPEEYYEKFADVDFELPENYLPENDPHADNWARLSPEQRTDLQEWMRVYHAMTANLDWNIGRLLEAMEKMGLDENTIFVFTSDHGEMFGAHGRRAKNIFYDEAVRVPFLVRWKGKIAEGSNSDILLNSPDIMPTLLGMLNLDCPEEVEGFDFSAALQGESRDEPEAAFLQGMGCTADWRDGYEWRAVRTKQFTYALYLADGQELLFDNKNDPTQKVNLAGSSDYSDIQQRLKAMLEQRMNCLKDEFRECTWYRDNWTEDRNIKKCATKTFSA